MALSAETPGPSPPGAVRRGGVGDVKNWSRGDWGVLHAFNCRVVKFAKDPGLYLSVCCFLSFNSHFVYTARVSLTCAFSACVLDYPRSDRTTFKFLDAACT
jgi:hypothetical protein